LYFFCRKKIGIPSDIWLLIRKLRLRQPGQGVFIPNNESNRVLLKRIEQFVTFGTPSVQTIRLLLEKRGKANIRDVTEKEDEDENGFIDNSEVPLINNKIIEDYFVKKGVSDGSLICLEDLIHEISTVGPHFALVSEFLLPFQISSSIHWKRNRRLYSEGGKGERGDRGVDIDLFVEKCLG
jgi:large subunit ribosomal protein L7e